MSVWDAIVEYLDAGIFGGTAGTIIMIAFILGLSAFGLYKSRKIFTEV